MTVYGFASRNVAQGLHDLYVKKGWRMPTTGIQDNGYATTGYLLRTPVAGIPARSGQFAGKAECTLLSLSVDGEIADAIQDGNTLTVDVYNPFGSGIGGDRIITAKRVFGLLVVDAEDCA